MSNDTPLAPASAPNAFAALVGELMGAQKAAELVAQIWERAPDDVKARFAEAVVGEFEARLLSQLRYLVDNAVGKAVSEIVGDLMAARKEEVVTAVKREIEARFGSCVRAKAEALLADILANVRQEVHYGRR